MNRAGRIIAVCGLSMALMMPQAAYAAETLSVQVSAREGITTVGNKQSAYDNVAISHVSNYVNIRSEANTSSSIVGKIYNNCAATILATVDGEGGTWYQIQSGSVKGYIKSEYFITGAEAEKIAKNVGTVYVTVSADGLNLRERPNMNSAVLTTLSKDSEYLEVKEDGDFIEIQVDESLSGYVHKDYVTQRVEFKQAVSVEEEKQKAEEAARIKKEADDAIAKVEELKKESGQSTENKDTPSTSIGMIAQNPNADNGTTKEQTNQSSQGSTSQNTGNTAGPGGDGSNTSTGSSTGTSGSYQDTQNGPGSAVYDSAVRTAIVAYAKQFLGLRCGSLSILEFPPDVLREISHRMESRSPCLRSSRVTFCSMRAERRSTTLRSISAMERSFTPARQRPVLLFPTRITERRRRRLRS